jgi:hypothetical protein
MVAVVLAETLAPLSLAAAIVRAPFAGPSIRSFRPCDGRRATVEWLRRG